MNAKWTFSVLMVLSITISRTETEENAMQCRQYCRQKQMVNGIKVPSDSTSPKASYINCFVQCKRARRRRALDGNFATFPPGVEVPDFNNPATPSPLETGKYGCGPGWPNTTDNSSIVLTQQSINDLRFYCEKKKRNNTVHFNALYVQWFVEEKYVKHISGFRLYYGENSARNLVDSCVEVGKLMRSVRLTIDLPKSGDVRIAITPLPIYIWQVLDYVYVNCQEPVEIGPRTIESRGTPLVIWVTLGCVATLLTLLVVVGWVAMRRSRRESKVSLRQRGTAGSVTYFSHCFHSDEDIDSLLTFAADLTSSYGIVCRIDLLEQRKIDRLTLAVWLNAQLAASDKVLVFINKRYLEAWKQYELCPALLTDDCEIMKILYEMCYVQQHLMDFGDKTAKIICLLSEDVQRNELPDFLRRSPVYKWPMCPANEANIVSCIEGMEIRELGV